MVSESSSTKTAPLATPCECGHTRNFHTGWGIRMHPCTECTCGNFRAKPDLRCTCGCPRSQHMGKPRGCQVHAFHAFVCDHSQCGWKPREDAHDFVSPAHCADCSKLWGQCPKACSEGHTYSGSCMLRADGPEPPLTPEEEEVIAAKFAEHLPPPEGPEYTPCGCGHIEPEHDFQALRCDGDDCECTAYLPEEAPAISPGHPEGQSHGDCATCWQGPQPECICCNPELADGPPPPQPERRPPYAVDYSAGGHAFQVLVPGDAAVLAVDGALIIRHADFPVLGISCITPLKTEAS